MSGEPELIVERGAYRFIRIGGRRVGWVYRGKNGRYFGCSIDIFGYPNPVGPAEYLRGTGCRTVRQAAEAFAWKLEEES